MENNCTFDWNDEINAENAFALLPEGDYEFAVTKFERGIQEQTDKLPRCNKAVVTLAVFGGNDEITLTENFPLCSKVEWKISSLFLSVGMKKHGEPLHMDWNGLIGKRGRCRIVTEPYNGKDYNKIKKFYAYDEDADVIKPSSAKPPVRNNGWQAGKF
ncbi:MAG: hypothetical protein NC395_11595 [Prevotella sp.]|nr:hypothetical protein [Prevotella sp.]